MKYNRWGLVCQTFQENRKTKIVISTEVEAYSNNQNRLDLNHFDQLDQWIRWVGSFGFSYKFLKILSIIYYILWINMTKKKKTLYKKSINNVIPQNMNLLIVLQFSTQSLNISSDG